MVQGHKAGFTPAVLAATLAIYQGRAPGFVCRLQVRGVGVALGISEGAGLPGGRLGWKGVGAEEGWEVACCSGDGTGDALPTRKPAATARPCV